ncbi:transposase [Streptomyces sp. NPDC029041]|uniref:transposase n=1 Tax=Streptomyces sp. NPDC029041 TaxID=3155727 RepID=UPI0033FF4BC7
MRAWVAEQDRLTRERSPAYAPELNPVELLWSSLKKRELANLAGDHLVDVADATEADSTDEAVGSARRIEPRMRRAVGFPRLCEIS